MGWKVLARRRKWVEDGDRVEDGDGPSCSSRMLPNDLVGKDCVLNTCMDIDLNLAHDECCLQHCRALPGSPVRPAVVSPAAHAASTGGCLASAELLVSRDSREELAERNSVENRANAGLFRRREILARKRKCVEDDDSSGRSSGSLSKDLVGKDCVLDSRRDDSRGRKDDELSTSIERWNTSGSVLVTNGCRSIVQQSTDYEYVKDSILNTWYEDEGFEKGSDSSTSARNEFLELDDTRVCRAEITNRNSVLGEQCTDAGCGEVAEGVQKKAATKNLPPSIIVSNGEDGGVKSSMKSSLYCALPEKEIKNHDSSGRSNFVTAPCGHDMSQEAISSSTSSAKLYDVIKTFSQKRAKRHEKGDILTIAIEKGIMTLPPIRWWRPGGYDAEEH